MGEGAAHFRIGMASQNSDFETPESRGNRTPHPQGSTVASLEIRPSKSDPTVVSYRIE